MKDCCYILNRQNVFQKFKDSENDITTAPPALPKIHSYFR